MNSEDCKVTDHECHLNRIEKWHSNFESYIALLIETLEKLNASSIEATKECSEHYKETVELTKAKTRFTFEISHELKAPLASIYNIINVILSGYLDGDIDKQKEFLNRAKLRIKSITGLLDDLLMFSRLEERANELDKEKFNIGELFTSLTEDMNEYAKYCDIEINWNLCDNCPGIYGNAELIRRVFANLIQNSIKYSNPGDRVEVTGQEEKDLFLFIVKDHGTGITEEDLPKIFNMFFRGENDRYNLRKDGIGLGLSLVKRIVNAHGGCIKVKSQLHEGTTIEVRFPETQKKEK
ncbi:MAG: HAMP domain-containing histidine kinase [Candidatus Aegiribacteria sp.]|nr:HAMP domain-containing histidine kinase [Candidatus Aegiribacteria sp.]